MVTDIFEFKAAKEVKQKPLISRRRASIAAGSLVTALADCEPNDLRATFLFDLTPDDVTAIESFIFHLQHRTGERLNGYQQRTERAETKPTLPGA